MKQDPNSLPADEVIEKFGGLRPLANRLGVAASTVQGWKQRGAVPENKVALVLNAALEDGIELSTASVTHKDKAATDTTDRRVESKFTQKQNGDSDPTAGMSEEDRRAYRERRKGRDRRQAQDPDFKGPDRRVSGRRSGIDRRQKRAEEWVHKKKFLERWVLTMSFMFIAVVLAGTFLLAPEYMNMKQRADNYAALEREIDSVNARLAEYREAQGSISGRLNEGLSRVGQVKDEIMTRVEAAEKTASEFADGGWRERAGFFQEQFTDLAGMMDRVDSLKVTPGGTEALMESLSRIDRSIDQRGAASPEALEAARQDDPVLSTLTHDMGSDDLKAAAMLLTLNELRGNVGQDAVPFSQDLERLEKLSGDDPETLAAIERLAPYARSGVLSQERLKQEFKELAGEIVMAKFRGEDASVQERALARLDDMMTIRRVDDLESDSTDAVVARAQLMLEEGNVQEAILELQSLEGESAEVAQPWVQHARTRVAADDASSEISQQIVQQLTQGQDLSPAALKQVFQSLLGGSGQAAVVSNPGSRARDGGVYPGLVGQ